ncbi:Protein of unknown function DUF241 [Macleaya cordata]|uniref:DUF241 domain protein n=1 Tax=Macleaya cordata TaxID=56857 RepID=A0A200QYU8_MACCD|nr:Protein of unknown function DUF241 [Macleaya cordata]
MSTSIATLKASGHARSSSVPSISHPVVSRVDDLLCRLRTSEAVTSSSSSSICHNMGDINNLYECVDDLLQFPFTQQALTGQDRNEKWVEQVLDGSLRLLDVCGTTRDVLLQMKESVQDLESSLRRRKGGEFCVANDVAAYISSRKKVSKVISKCLGDLKRIENNNISPLDKEPEVASMIRQVERITLSMFESILSFTSGSKARSKPINGWSLVSKVMHSKRIACQETEMNINEMEKVDVALKTFLGHKSSSCKEIDELHNVKKQLVALEMSIQGLEDGLECVFRHLMRTRVSLLNILSY